MHAIGEATSRELLNGRILYTSSERFMNQMIHCVKQDRMQLFQNYYRSADVLLVDDTQIIAGKERTQEEFYHMFNDLLDRQKQIVITSDTPPKSLSGLMDRLKSRFEWGLSVDFQPPDLETKLAILAQKAKVENVVLPQDVCILIATKTGSNIRELEGALVRLMVCASVTNQSISLTMAHQVLRHLIHHQSRKVTFGQIIKEVSDHFELSAATLKAKSNVKDAVRARQIAIYLAKELTGASVPEIGRVFGGKHRIN